MKKAWRLLEWSLLLALVGCGQEQISANDASIKPSGGVVELFATSVNASPGSVVAVAVGVGDPSLAALSPSQVGGVQGTLSFDPAALRFKGAAFGGASPTGINARAAAQGIIRLAVGAHRGAIRSATLHFDVIAPSWAATVRFRPEKIASLGNLRPLPVPTTSSLILEPGLRLANDAGLTTQAQLISAERFQDVRRPGEIIPGLVYGNADLQQAPGTGAQVDLNDVILLLNAAVGATELLMESGSPSIDLVVAGNVWPHNAPGLGEFTDPSPPGLEADGSRQIDIMDAVSVLNELADTSEPVVGQVIPGRIAATQTIVDVSGTITASQTWTAGTTYRLIGKVIVTNGAVLAIQAGAQVEGVPSAGSQAAGELVAMRDGRVVVAGTMLEPVVMTCAGAAKYKGCWGGLTLNGNALLNEGGLASPAVAGRSAGGCIAETDFGGCTDSDSSGALRYLRIEYAGAGSAGAGLDLRGVGSRTLLEYIQVHQSGGSGVLVQGGDAQLKRVVVTASRGTGLQWTLGWRGRVQYLVVQQDTLESGAGIGGWNARANRNASPRATPTLHNLTVVGRMTPDWARGAPGSEVNAGLYFRRGTRPIVANTIVQGFYRALQVEDDASCGNPLEVTNSVFAGNYSLGAALPTACAGTAATFLGAPARSNTFPASSPIRSAFDTDVPDFRVAFGSAFTVAPAPTGGFFEAAGYAGAVPPANGSNSNVPWFAGWTRGTQVSASTARVVTGNTQTFYSADVEVWIGPLPSLRWSSSTEPRKLRYTIEKQLIANGNWAYTLHLPAPVSPRLPIPVNLDIRRLELDRNGNYFRAYDRSGQLIGFDWTGLNPLWAPSSEPRYSSPDTARTFPTTPPGLTPLLPRAAPAPLSRAGAVGLNELGSVGHALTSSIRSGAEGGPPNRAHIERQMGPSVGTVRGLERFVHRKALSLSEVLVDSRTGLVIEENLMRDGRLVVHTLHGYGQLKGSRDALSRVKTITEVAGRPGQATQRIEYRVLEVRVSPRP